MLPPITGLAQQNVRISIDTRHGDVMARACAAGAGIINDVEALRGHGAVEAAVAMLRVYCSCPGVSAMMNLRLAVEK